MINFKLRKLINLYNQKDYFKKLNLGYDDMLSILPKVYNEVGVKNFNPTHKEMINILEKMDMNSDGRISLEEYEIFVLKALTTYKQTK